MRTNAIRVALVCVVALTGSGCGASGPSAEELNKNSGGAPPVATGGSVSSGNGGALVTSGGSASGGSTSGGSTSGGSTSGGSDSSGTGGAAAGMPAGGSSGTGGSAGMPMGATGGTIMDGGTGGAAVGGGGTSVGEGGTTAGQGGMGGMGGTTAGEGGIGGMGGGAESTGGTGPYAPRTGSFKMLAYSRTTGFRHDSIPAGKQMLQQIAQEQGFEITITETNEDITPTGLEQYEIVFFMNSTGDIFNATEQQTYEDWMTNKNGAFGGTHSATDTENGWAFYSEVTGQYYDGHDNCCGQANVQWDPDALSFIAVQGLPSPWQRAEEWYYFNKNADWASKAGFKILGRVTTNANTRPVSYVREWGNFRAFYTSIGHQSSAFEDAEVKKHVAAGIMWAVRREALLK